MAHFYGVVRNDRGQATRCGHRQTGLITIAASWNGCVHTTLTVRDGKDWATVELRQWKGAGPQPAIIVYDGPIAGQPESTQEHELREALKS